MSQGYKTRKKRIRLEQKAAAKIPGAKWQDNMPTGKSCPMCGELLTHGRPTHRAETEDGVKFFDCRRTK